MHTDDQPAPHSPQAPDPSNPSRPSGHSREGMSNVTIVVLLLAGFALFFALLCGGGALYFYKNFEFDIQEDPGAAIAATETIADIDIPPPFEPEAAMFMDMIYMDMTMAFYSVEDAEGLLMLTEMNVTFGDREEAEHQLQQSTGEESFDDDELIILSKEYRDFEIRGETTTFHFAEAQHADTGEPFRQVAGVFLGRGDGLVLLRVDIEEEFYDEDSIVTMIESIR